MITPLPIVRIILTAIAFVAAACANINATPFHDPRERVVQIVAALQRADYEGDREGMLREYDALRPFMNDVDFGTRVRYWRGFAQWRRAINGFNDGVDPNELEQNLKEAVAEFKIAAENDPAFVDAKVGMISSLGYLAFINKKEPSRTKELIEQVMAIVKEADAAAPDNPRLIWVHGPIYWNTPPDRGGGQDKFIEAYEQALQNWSQLKTDNDPLAPSWGKPELMMGLAYAYLSKKVPDLDAAERYARAALEIVPYWHYTRDILLPKILAAKAQSGGRQPR